MKYQLKRPIKIGDAPEITTFTVREEVCAGDMRGLKVQALNDPSVDDMLKMAGRLAAQPDEVMNRLSPADLVEVTVLVMGFLTAGQQTGTTP